MLNKALLDADLLTICFYSYLLIHFGVNFPNSSENNAISATGKVNQYAPKPLFLGCQSRVDYRMKFMSKAVIAASRFGFGARPGELKTAGRIPQKWLLVQLQGPPRLHDEIRRLPGSAKMICTLVEIFCRRLTCVACSKVC
jgi:hypothetical protein